MTKVQALNRRKAQIRPNAPGAVRRSPKPRLDHESDSARSINGLLEGKVGCWPLARSFDGAAAPGSFIDSEVLLRYTEPVGAGWSGIVGGFRRRHSDFAPIEPPLLVEMWNTACAQFAFGIPAGWRSMTPDEAAAQGAGRVEVLGGALSEPADARCAVMAAIWVSTGDIHDALRWPDRWIAKRSQGDARLTAGPERLRVAEGRALQIHFDETVSGESYGSESPILQTRAETVFEGIGSAWVFQLIGPADAAATHLNAYRTALGTWQWT
jgi:hypothetical protein